MEVTIYFVMFVDPGAQSKAFTQKNKRPNKELLESKGAKINMTA